MSDKALHFPVDIFSRSFGEVFEVVNWQKVLEAIDEVIRLKLFVNRAENCFCLCLNSFFVVLDTRFVHFALDLIGKLIEEWHLRLIGCDL